MENTDAAKGAVAEEPTSFRDRFALRRLDVGIILIVALGVGFWVYLRGNRAYEGMLGRPLRVGIVAWSGYAGGLVANNGLRPNKDSYFWSKHKLLVEFVEQEDESQLLSDFANGKLDIIWSTVDSLALQAPELQKKGVQPRAFMQVDWSRGGDAIVASADIERIEDLKGKRVAVSLTASQWLLEDSLEHCKLTDPERDAIRQSRITTNGSQEAGNLFVSKNVDAAALWEPDVTHALEARTGAHRLIDTSTATKLIADVMVAKKEFIEQHHDVIVAFVDGWLLYGTTEAIKDPMLAAKVLQNEQGFANLGEQKTQELLGRTAWATLNDNVEMFGLSGGKAFFDDLFSQASHLWLKQGYMTNSVAADQARDIKPLKEVYRAKSLLPGPNCGKETPMQTIELAIAFHPNKADLSQDAKSILDNQDALFILQTHTGACFCVQSDRVTGDASQTALQIGRAREKEVIDYLVEHYGRPREQFASASADAAPQTLNVGTRTFIRLQLNAGRNQQ
jgi:NitT/TauT family transport system substrate-binding protein